MGKKLVAYFTASGLTGKAARRIADAAEAETFEIRPEKRYTEADLKWTNPFARCNREKFGKKELEYVGDVEDFASYDTVFVGFPIWYFSCPPIVQKFLQDHDFTGKKVVLFATSGGTDIMKIISKVSPFLGEGVEPAAAKLLRTTDGMNEIRAWLEELEQTAPEA